ncbi:hypothetical protein [Tolypothrix sp. VBCCA 56010]|uniref:hypothetical protein n=1 Tax=Tolypothrix sp. VBCCA 56010 TaxID=3137731 RepID=UPI003D7D7F98
METVIVAYIYTKNLKKLAPVEGQQFLTSVRLEDEGTYALWEPTFKNVGRVAVNLRLCLVGSFALYDDRGAVKVSVNRKVFLNGDREAQSTYNQVVKSHLIIIKIYIIDKGLPK